MKNFSRLAAIVALLLVGVTDGQAQSAPKKYLSLASTNSNLVRTGSSVLHAVLAVNTTSTIYYLKLYNKASAPTCGTDVPLMTIPVPQGIGAGAGVAMSSADGLLFANGLGFCLTAGIADNDTNAAAAGVAINFGVGGN